MISTYRMAMLQVLDLVCILLALSITGFLTVESDLSIFHDYTGATLFTIFFYMLFFYILDAYSVGNEDFKETVGRVLVACLLGIVSSATASYAFQHWRFDRETVAMLFAAGFTTSMPKGSPIPCAFCWWGWTAQARCASCWQRGCPRPKFLAMWASAIRGLMPGPALVRPSWLWTLPKKNRRP